MSASDEEILDYEYESDHSSTSISSTNTVIKKESKPVSNIRQTWMRYLKFWRISSHDPLFSSLLQQQSGSGEVPPILDSPRQFPELRQRRRLRKKCKVNSGEVSDFVIVVKMDNLPGQSNESMDLKCPPEKKIRTDASNDEAEPIPVPEVVDLTAESDEPSTSTTESQERSLRSSTNDVEVIEISDEEVESRGTPSLTGRQGNRVFYLRTSASEGKSPIVVVIPNNFSPLSLKDLAMKKLRLEGLLEKLIDKRIAALTSPSTLPKAQGPGSSTEVALAEAQSASGSKSSEEADMKPVDITTSLEDAEPEDKGEGGGDSTSAV